MNKTWRHPRQIIVHQSPAEPQDAKRFASLVSLLATGVERLLIQDEELCESVDFQAKASPNTPTRKEPAKMGNA